MRCPDVEPVSFERLPLLTCYKVRGGSHPGGLTVPLRTGIIKCLLLLIFLTVGYVSVVRASEAALPIAPSEHVVLPSSASDNNVAAEFAALTSLAISPILVGDGRSAIIYLRATEAERKLLPWTNSPWYWGSLLAVGISFFSPI